MLLHTIWSQSVGKSTDDDTKDYLDTTYFTRSP